MYNENKTISISNWFFSELVMFIPIVNLIVLIIWASSSNIPESKSNWAIARLLGIGLLFALCLLILI